MNKSTELFIKISHLIVDNPKIVVLSCEARWAFIEGLVYSARNMTDGLIDRRILHRMWPDSIIQELANNDDDAPSWQLLENGDVQIHGFCEWQMSNERRAEIVEKRSNAGKKSGEVRRANKARTSVEQVFEQNANKNELEKETEEEKETDNNTNRGNQTLPESFELSPRLRLWAKQVVPTIDVEEQFAAFKAYYLANNEKRSNWNQVFQAWLQRAEERRPKTPATEYVTEYWSQNHLTQEEKDKIRYS